MGLFDRKKKENKVQENTVLQTDEDKIPASFTMMVEAYRGLENGQGVMVGGILHGKVKEGQSVFLIQPSGLTIRTDVMRVEIGPDNVVDSAVNTRVALFLSGIRNPEQAPKFSVVSSFKPVISKADDTIINPQLMGLAWEFPKYCSSPQYLSIFAYIMCHSKFVAATKNNTEVLPAEDGTTLSKFYYLNNSQQPDKKFISIYTDSAAMKLWPDYKKENPSMVSLSFPDVVNITKESEGAIINAYGPMPVYITKEYIENITSMEGYKKEFGEV